MQTLSDLARLRGQGKAPALPVLISDLYEPFASNLSDVGAMVIHAGVNAETWDWTPVTGLDVLLFLRKPRDRYGLALAIRDARPRRLQSFDWSAPIGERCSVNL